MTYHITQLTMSCLSQGTVGLMPMLQGHNQLPELLYPPRMTSCGFVGCHPEWLPPLRWPYYCHLFFFVCLFGLTGNFDHHVFLGRNKINKTKRHQKSHSCTGFPQFQGNERQHLFPSSQKPWRIMALQYLAICIQSS